MKLSEPSLGNVLERTFYGIKKSLTDAREALVPLLRRGIRFIALPYLLIYEIDWSLCTRPKLVVLYDLLWIFFRLKYYPDNYFLCRFWKLSREEWVYYYGSIYDPYQRKRFSRQIYQRENMVLFENKQVCYSLCESVGLPLPRQFGMLYPHEDYAAKIRGYLRESARGKIILKVFDGMGGKGIVVAQLSGNDVQVKRGDVVCALDQFELNRPCVVQDYVSQHHELNRYSTSSNTLRVATMLKHDFSDVLIVGAFIRFGVGSSDIDNLSSGGIAAGIDVSSGKTYDYALNFNGEEFLTHPNSGLGFKGLTVPCWDEVVSLSKKVQWHFCYHKVLGLDICITETGPVVIEINSEIDMVALEMTYGPILKRPEVYQEFKAYDLLINSPSRALFSGAAAGSKDALPQSGTT